MRPCVPPCILFKMWWRQTHADLCIWGWQGVNLQLVRRRDTPAHLSHQQCVQGCGYQHQAQECDRGSSVHAEARYHSTRARGAAQASGAVASQILRLLRALVFWGLQCWQCVCAWGRSWKTFCSSQEMWLYYKQQKRWLEKVDTRVHRVQDLKGAHKVTPY